LVGDVMDNFLRISWLNEIILMLQTVLSSMFIEINENFWLSREAPFGARCPNGTTGSLGLFINSSVKRYPEV